MEFHYCSFSIERPREWKRIQCVSIDSFAYIPSGHKHSHRRRRQSVLVDDCEHMTTFKCAFVVRILFVFKCHHKSMWAYYCRYIIKHCWHRKWFSNEKQQIKRMIQFFFTLFLYTCTEKKHCYCVYNCSESHFKAFCSVLYILQKAH